MSKFLNYPLPLLYNVIHPAYLYHSFSFLSIRTNYEQHKYYNDYQHTRTTKEIFDLVYTGKVKEIGSLLKQEEIKPNLYNDNGISLLNYALDYNQFKIAQLLILHGANLMIKDAKGRRPNDIINQKKNGEMSKDLEELSEMLSFVQPNEPPIQDFVQPNENQEEIEVGILGYNIAEYMII